MDVEESWSQIVGWCRENARETAASIRPAAGEAALSKAVIATTGSWPEDLLTLYRQCDGAQRGAGGYLLPGYCLMSLKEVEKHHIMMLRIWDDIVEDARVEAGVEKSAWVWPQNSLHAEHWEAQPAGLSAGRFLSTFVPFGDDLSGSTLFVDTRPGDLRGCVSKYHEVEGNIGPVWPSAAEMLEAILASLIDNSPVNSRRPRVRDGYLAWHLDDL